MLYSSYFDRLGGVSNHHVNSASYADLECLCTSTCNHGCLGNGHDFDVSREDLS